MYIFELIIQYIKGKKYKSTRTFNPLENDTDSLVENSENCEHLFLPLDSSNENFACKHCGLIVKREMLKNKNIFENKSF